MPESPTKEERDWEAESAADTIMRAEELKANSALHKKALTILEKRQEALTKVVGAPTGMDIRRKRRLQK